MSKAEEKKEALKELSSVCSELKDQTDKLVSIFKKEWHKKKFVYHRKHRILRNSDYNANILSLSSNLSRKIDNTVRHINEKI